jgi:hypothetical protein
MRGERERVEINKDKDDKDKDNVNLNSGNNGRPGFRVGSVVLLTLSFR